MDMPSPEAVVAHVIRLMGGHDKAFQTFADDFRSFTTCWDQDTVTIGRILRAHLFVEHFVTDFVQLRNPELGSLDKAHVSFSQKIDLIGTGSFGVSHLLPGLRRLNAIRNRIAHSLRAEITDRDAGVFLGIGLFRAMREEKARRSETTLSQDPVDILEEFALHAGNYFQAGATGNDAVWAEAFRAARDDCAQA
jgi:hypothetical protein